MCLHQVVTTPLHDVCYMSTSRIDTSNPWEGDGLSKWSYQSHLNTIHCLIDRWNLRIDAMHKARRAYQKALHLSPDQGSLWGDLGATFYHEAQRLLRGGVRLEGSSAPLWGGLGMCAWQPHVQVSFSPSAIPGCGLKWVYMIVCR